MTELTGETLHRLSPAQRQTAKFLGRSRAETVEVTVFGEIDVSAMAALRDDMRANGPAPTVTHFVVAALARTLIAHPRFNAHLVDGALRLKQQVDLGFAVSLDNGDLVSPVLRNVCALGLEEIAQAAGELAGRARKGALQLSDVKGAGFTFSSVGGSGIARFATAVLPVPQVGILAAMAIREMPVVHDGEMKAAAMLPVSLSFDHRAVNGAAANLFLETLAAQFADPRALFLPARNKEGHVHD